MGDALLQRILFSTVLKKYINPVYLHHTTLHQMSAAYHTPTQPHIHLHDFLLPSVYKRMLRSLEKQRGKKMHEPDRSSFSLVNGDLFFVSQEFFEYLSCLTGVPFQSPSVETRRFTWKDYVLSQPVSRSTHSAVFFLGDKIPENGGGYWCCTTEKEEVFRVPPTPNSLALAYLKPPLRTFIKYLNKKTEGRGLFTTILSTRPQGTRSSLT